MKKIDKKAFNLMKVMFVIVMSIVCGLYYVLFIKNDIEKQMETVAYIKSNNAVYNETAKSSKNPTSAAKNIESDVYIIEIEPTINLPEESIIENSEEDEKLFYYDNNKIDINNASSDELQSLKNIGPVVASNIIAYREENGNFLNIEDIKNVKGIGDAKFNSIKDSIYAG